MRTVFKVLAILTVLSVIGNLIAGKIFIAGIILAGIFAYFGWRDIPVKSASNGSESD